MEWPLHLFYTAGAVLFGTLDVIIASAVFIILAQYRIVKKLSTEAKE